MFDSQAIAALAHNGAIPSPPDLIGRLVRLLATEDYSAADVAEIVESDSSAAARVISVANSALYVGSREARSVREAVSRLGVRVTRDVVSSHAMRSAFSPRNGHALKLLKTEWRLSTGVASLMRQAAQDDRSLGSPDVAYTLGLFHNVGLPVLICAIRDDQQVDAMMFYKSASGHAGVVGGLMARRWYLSEETYRLALRFGRARSEDGWQLAECAAYARVVAARALGAAYCIDPDLDGPAFQALTLAQPEIPRLSALQKSAAALAQAGRL
ncbi:MAG: hypothetical protein CMN28_16900 [Salinisphaeraceae bacterium]|nr:hypothetical protein [Salinisphaeraceae bacterium]